MKWGHVMKEYLSIGEIAKIFDMDVQLLRHYDAKGLLVPEIRDDSNNRRMYHFDQIYPLATIRYLRRLGYPLTKIGEFLRANDLQENLKMLIDQVQELQRQRDELLAVIQIIQSKVEFIERELAISHPGKVFTKEYPPRPFLQIGEELNLFTHEFFYFYPTVGFYQGDKKWFGAYLYDDRGLSAKGTLFDYLDSGKIPLIQAGKYLCGYHYGTYQTIQDSIEKLYKAGAGLALSDCVITLNIVDQFFEGHPANYITALEIQILE